MNIQLSNTEEYINRKHTGTLGQVLIRYNKLRYPTQVKNASFSDYSLD